MDPVTAFVYRATIAMCAPFNYFEGTFLPAIRLGLRDGLPDAPFFGTAIAIAVTFGAAPAACLLLCICCCPRNDATDRR